MLEELESRLVPSTAVNDDLLNLVTYQMTQETTLNTDAITGVFQNDTHSVLGSTLSLNVASAPSVGTLTVFSNGSFTYKAPVGFTGNVTWTYSETESGVSGVSNTATVTIQVLASSYTPASGLPTVVEPGGGPWARFHHDNSDSGTTAIGAPALGSPIWSNNLGFEIKGSPVIYMSSATNEVSVIVGDAGGVLHSYPTHFYSSPLIAPVPNGNAGTPTPTGLIVIGTEESQAGTLPGTSQGSLRAYRPDGTEVWRTLLDGRVHYSPIFLPAVAASGSSPATPRTIVVGTDIGTTDNMAHIYRIDAITGAIYADVGVLASITANPAFDTAGSFVYVPAGTALKKLSAPAATPAGLIQLSNTGSDITGKSISQHPFNPFNGCDYLW